MTPKETAAAITDALGGEGRYLNELEEGIEKAIIAAIAEERSRCLALVNLEIESAEEEKQKAFGFDLIYIEGWFDALKRLKVKFEDKTDE